MYLYTYTHIYIYIYIYIYPEKDAVRSPFFTFLGMQCFCYIMFDHLCSYTCDGIARDPHRLSDFLRKERPESHEDPQRKEGGKTNIVCVYIWLPLGGEVAKEKKDFFFPSFSPLLALLCT